MRKSEKYILTKFLNKIGFYLFLYKKNIKLTGFLLENEPSLYQKVIYIQYIMAFYFQMSKINLTFVTVL